MLTRWLFKLTTQTHIFLYRLTGGSIGGRLWGLPVLLLTTTGRKTGKERTVALAYLDDGANHVITASGGGPEDDPAWFKNLKSDPQVVIQVMNERRAATAEQADPEKRSELWARLLEVAPGYGDYQKRTSREIPMVILRPAG